MRRLAIAALLVSAALPARAEPSFEPDRDVLRSTFYEVCDTPEGTAGTLFEVATQGKSPYVMCAYTAIMALGDALGTKSAECTKRISIGDLSYLDATWENQSPNTAYEMIQETAGYACGDEYRQHTFAATN
jgi:hypothetical protein